MADEQKVKTGGRLPAVWVPTLYFTQGFPLTVVLLMATAFFKTMSVSLEALGIFQGIFGLPWAFKFLWSPLVELFRTKRGWILAMQGALACALGLVAFKAASPSGGAVLSFHIGMVNLADKWANTAFTLGALALVFSFGFGMDKKRSAAIRAFCKAVAASVVVLMIVFHKTIFMVHNLALPSTIWILFGLFCAIAFLSATHDIAIDGFYLDALTPKAQAGYSGIRVMCYRLAMLFGSGVLLIIAGKQGWSLGFGIGAAVFFLFFLFHLWYLPRSVSDTAPGETPHKKSFSDAFATYLDQKRIIAILLFIILFRIDDAFWKPMAIPFLMDIGVSVEQIGYLQGVLGMIGTIVGTVLGGLFISWQGLKRSLWVLGIIHGSNMILYVYLAHRFPVVDPGTAISQGELMTVAVVNFLENFSIGLGTIAFVNFLMRTCKKEYTAAHYAIATGLMAISGMMASFFSGFLAEQFGYLHYFLFCVFISIPGLVLLLFLPLSEMDKEAKAAQA